MDEALPSLREELDLVEGSRLEDGQPSWILHDPARHRFYRIDWMSFEILSRWSLGDAQAIAASVRAATPLVIDQSQVLQLLDFLQQNQLLMAVHPQHARRMAAAATQDKDVWWRIALHHYLFFRVPLWRPDAWLTRWMPVARIAFGRGFHLATVMALLIGLMMVLRESDAFLHTLQDTFSAAGLAGYLITLTAVKLLHELGHAFAAKSHGCRVPVIGVAFVLLWPMAYTDTNESWRLADPRQRLQVASAGILTELAVAAWATFAWPFLPEGALKTAVFFLATTSLVTTIAVNLSPFMRFDGYFVLSDFLDIPNLHERSFAMARWQLRETIFALKDPPPEEFNARRRRFLILFAWFTWCYRLVVFFGIALLVYQFFFKLLGLLLFLVEIGWFIVRPLTTELLAWRTLAPRLLRHPRGAARLGLWLGLLALAGMMLFLPLPYRVVVAGVVHPQDYMLIRPPFGARLDAVEVKVGQRVARDQLLVQLAQPDLTASWRLAKVREDALRWRAASAGLNDASRTHLLAHESEWVKAAIDGNTVAGQLESLLLRAPFPGVVVDIAPDLRPGRWLSAREKIGLLVNPDGGVVAETYVEEMFLDTVRAGDKATFVDQDGRVFGMVVTQVDRDATRQLPSGLFGTSAGGPVSLRLHDGVLVPERAVYRVLLKPAIESVYPGAAMSRFICGTISIESDGVRVGWRYIERALSVFRREAGV